MGAASLLHSPLGGIQRVVGRGPVLAGVMLEYYSLVVDVPLFFSGCLLLCHVERGF